jgi:hypothetical protein
VSVHPPVLINITLAFLALALYIVGSRRFYLDRRPFLVFLVAAVLIDGLTAVLASFGITPTTKLPYSDFVPWRSRLFLAHVVLASIGLFGFLVVILVLSFRGTRRSYPRLRRFQYRVLLPIWVVGEGIALVNSLIKTLLRVRIYDYL